MRTLGCYVVYPSGVLFALSFVVPWSSFDPPNVARITLTVEVGLLMLVLVECVVGSILT